MKKKILTFILALAIILPSIFMLSACGGGAPAPKTEEEQTYDLFVSNYNYARNYNGSFSNNKKVYENNIIQFEERWGVDVDSNVAYSNVFGQAVTSNYTKVVKDGSQYYLYSQNAGYSNSIVDEHFAKAYIDYGFYTPDFLKYIDFTKYKTLDELEAPIKDTLTALSRKQSLNFNYIVDVSRLESDPTWVNGPSGYSDRTWIKFTITCENLSTTVLIYRIQTVETGYLYEGDEAFIGQIIETCTYTDGSDSEKIEIDYIQSFDNSRYNIVGESDPVVPSTKFSTTMTIVDKDSNVAGSLALTIGEPLNQNQVSLSSGYELVNGKLYNDKSCTNEFALTGNATSKDLFAMKYGDFTAKSGYAVITYRNVYERTYGDNITEQFKKVIEATDDGYRSQAYYLTSTTSKTISDFIPYGKTATKIKLNGIEVNASDVITFVSATEYKLEIFYAETY